jgi:hypothetical protein
MTIHVDWLGGILAVLAAVCVYRSVSCVQSDTSGFGDPKTGKAFPHVRVNRTLLLIGLGLGVLSSLLSSVG